MSRCVICDYLEGHGSELHDIPNRWNKRVKWRPTHKEFQCDDCFNAVREVKQEFYSKDTAFDTAEQTDNSLPPTVSSLPIK